MKNWVKFQVKFHPTKNFRWPKKKKSLILHTKRHSKNNSHRNLSHFCFFQLYLIIIFQGQMDPLKNYTCVFFTPFITLVLEPANRTQNIKFYSSLTRSQEALLIGRRWWTNSSRSNALQRQLLSSWLMSHESISQLIYGRL